MALLLHFVAEPGTALPQGATGFRGAAVECRSRQGIACCFSRVDPQSVQQFAAPDAVALHNLAAAALAAGAIIPFRFPSLLADDAELDRYLAANSAHFLRSLERLRDTVQMELQIALAEPQHAAMPSSGRAYMAALRDRHASLRDARQELLARAAGLALAWAEVRQHPCALVRRAQSDAFRRAIASATLPPGIVVRVTGPWPPTAFLDETPAVKEAS